MADTTYVKSCTYPFVAPCLFASCAGLLHAVYVSLRKRLVGAVVQQFRIVTLSRLDDRPLANIRPARSMQGAEPGVVDSSS